MPAAFGYSLKKTRTSRDMQQPVYLKAKFNPNQHVIIRAFKRFKIEKSQPAKTSVSPRSSPPRTFREEERRRLSRRNSMLMTQTDFLIINRVVMGFQIQICPILCVLWSILVKCCVLLPTSSSKTQMRLQEKTIFHKY